MTDFWARKLGAATTAPAPAPVPAPPRATTQGAWWNIPVYSQPPGPEPAMPHAYEAPRRVAPSATPPSTRLSGTCPGCGSGNYFQVAKNVTTCYDCGWPVQHTTSGAMSTNDTAPSRPSLRQIKGSAFRPDIVVGHT